MRREKLGECRRGEPNFPVQMKEKVRTESEERGEREKKYPCVMREEREKVSMLDEGGERK